MKLWFIAAAAALALGGCGAKPSPQVQTRHDRYVGIGIYSPGEVWSKMVPAGSPARDAAARTSDDDQIIVVVDSDTGEIRQCGNLSGYCVGMNPWTKALTGAQTAPISLTAHVSDESVSANSSVAPSGR